MDYEDILGSVRDKASYTARVNDTGGTLSLSSMTQAVNELSNSYIDWSSLTASRAMDINPYYSYWQNTPIGPDYDSMKFEDLPENQKALRCQKIKQGNVEISFEEYEQMYHYWNMPTEQEIDASFHGRYGMGLETATAREVEMLRRDYSYRYAYGSYSPNITSAVGIKPPEEKTTSVIDWSKLGVSS